VRLSTNRDVDRHPKHARKEKCTKTGKLNCDHRCESAGSEKIDNHSMGSELVTVAALCPTAHKASSVKMVMTAVEIAKSPPLNGPS
jgi:hypothetical protein